MYSDEDLYCKIYIDTSIEKHILLNKIADIIKGDIQLRTVENKLLEVTLFKNKNIIDCNKIDKSDFVNYPYYLEIDPVDDTTFDEASYKKQLLNILKYFASKNINAVAACDYEDELIVSYAT